MIMKTTSIEIMITGHTDYKDDDEYNDNDNNGKIAIIYEFFNQISPPH